MLAPNEIGPSAIDSADRFTQHRSCVAVPPFLCFLDEKNHEKGYDGITSVDDELPRIDIAGYRQAQSPQIYI